MKWRWILGALLGLAVMAGLVTGCQLTRAGYETAPYRVVSREGLVEVRAYPALRVVTTPKEGDDFMRLFRYISRGNAAAEKIAMTTPVFMTGVGSAREQMAFVLPASLPNPPAPGNQAVSLGEVPAGTYAVRRFRGGTQDAGGPAATELRSWMSERQLPIGGDPVFAYFDPPWIPGFLCRNEVMIPTRWIEGQSAETAR
ncbi:MAG: heme-binding protein [Verrucomicrobia bacterium]|nr:heme-binding protein [Verrucomicrobiota bacterium]